MASLSLPVPPALARAEDIPRSRRLAALGFLMLAYFFYAWAWNTVDILRPYIRDSVGLTLAQSGWLYTIQSAGALVGAIVMGQMADRIGRRNALMLVMAGYGLTLVSGIFITSFAQLAAERAIMGFFMGSMYPIVVGIYAGLFPASSRGMIAGFIMGIYNVSVAALTFGSGLFIAAGNDWRMLLWAGLIPVVAVAFAPLVIPDDRRTVPWGIDPSAPRVAASRLPIAELFRPAVRRQTLMLACMTGLNFFAYQAFTGWATTYLKDVREMPADVIGTVVGIQFLASAAGGFFWGWLSDRMGRRVGAWGFLAASALIPVYLFAPLDTLAFTAVGFAYGFLLSSSAVWGPWLSELYPPHLRSTAASIFNWGRIISMLAPPLTAALVPFFGMGPVMMLGSLAFAAAAGIWRSLPETNPRGG
jgi:MFS family permease